MSRNEEIDGRRCHRHRYAAVRERLTDCARDVCIGDKFTEAKRCDGTPCLDLKSGSRQLERQIETPQPPRKIGFHLRACLGEQCVARFLFATGSRGDEMTGKYRRSVAYNQQIPPKRRGNPATRRWEVGRHAKSPVPMRERRTWPLRY